MSTEIKPNKKDNLEIILEALLDDDVALTSVCTQLIVKDKLEALLELLKKTSVVPHGVISFCVSYKMIDAFDKIKDLYIEELNADYIDPDAPLSNLESITLAQHLLNIINSFDCHTMRIDVAQAQTLKNMKEWITYNHMYAVCPKCENNLLDPDGEGIYNKGTMPYAFNKINKEFYMADTYYEPEDDKYFCCGCNANVTEIVEKYI